MASVNKVILVGNCGRDPEVRYLPSGQAVANVTLATSSRRKDKNTGETIEDTQWHRITFYDRLAEIAGEYVKKGRPIYVEGRLKYGKFTNKDGVEQNTCDIIATEMQLLGSREGMGGPGGDEGGGGGGGYSRPSAPPQRQAAAARPAPGPGTVAAVQRLRRHGRRHSVLTEPPAGSSTGLPRRATHPGKRSSWSVAPAITPPPRQTSPSYSTADCPGVTAHWASAEGQRERARRLARLQNVQGVALPVARLGGQRTGRRRCAGHPAGVVGLQRGVLQPGVVMPLHHPQRVALHVLARDEPRRVLAAATRRSLGPHAADAQALALADGVEAQPGVLADRAPAGSLIGPGAPAM
jgi:single-strand DNA-binding protein